MAEARSACHPVPGIGLHNFRVDPTLHTTQVAVSSDGFVLYLPHPRFMWRSLKRAVHETRTQLQTALWPLRPRMVFIFLMCFVLYVVLAEETSLRHGLIAEWLWWFDSCLPFTHYLPTSLRVGYLAFNTAFFFIFMVVLIQRALLRLLLSYHGWMFEGRGKRSAMTRIWGFSLWLICSRGILAGKPLLFSFQGALPSLRPPKIEDTLSKWLETVEPVVDAAKFAKLKEDAREFVQSGAAKQAQSYLTRKSLVYRNYVTDWWVQFVYLRGRTPLFINSNFYGQGDGDLSLIPTNKQLPRAASMVYHWLLARQMIDRERLPPLTINDLVPLCMDQYRPAFNSARIPGKECDRIRVWEMDETKHILVIYKGGYYTLSPYTQNSGELLKPIEIYRLLKGLVEAHDGPPMDSPEARIAALTTLERTKWASIREDYLAKGKYNRQTLDQIERSMFVLNLDDTAPEEYTDVGRQLFVGDGTNRWCDKSFSFVVFKNGRVGIHAEHTWADAPVMAHLFEWCLATEQKNKEFIYTPSGDLNETTEPKPFVKNDAGWQPKAEGLVSPRRLRVAQKLQWRITDGLKREIDAAVAGARKAMDDLDLEVRCHDAYGKGLIKKAGVSPDGWIQMALQLAYYRDQGRFDLTYESSMTRLFHQGRTETIRSCSKESCAWVKAMVNEQSTAEERMKLLKKACERHVNYSRMAMTGDAIDRHLFALYVVSVGKEIDAPFLQNALTMPWKLSTSQVPQRQTPKGTWPDDDMGDKYYSPSGGFGPVADDGYGVSYCVSGDLRFFFHVSSKKSCPTTNSTRMQEHIFKALQDMKAVIDEILPSKGK